MKKDKKVYIGIIMSILLVLLFMMPIFYIQSVEVSGNHYYKTEELVEMTGVKNKHFLDFSRFSIKKNILKLPYIQDVKVKYTFPGKVKITIEEKAPFAYVSFKGNYLCINAKAQVIEQTQQKYHDIPVIEGLEFDSFKNNETLPIKDQEQWLVAQAIITSLEKYNYVSKIDKIVVYNLQQIHLYVDKLDVIMGDIGDFDKKIKTLIAIHDEQGYTMGRLDLSVINTKLNAAYLEPIT